MKSLYTAFVLALLVTAFGGCKQDFDVTSTYKEIPVVYGLLSQQDAGDNHYIRIQRAYLTKGNAVLAQGVTDSIYYPNILKVVVKGILNGDTLHANVYNLTRIDGNTVNLPKDPGAFANTPNYLYFFHGALDQARKYRLEVTDTTTGKMVYAEEMLIANFTLATPSNGSKINLNNNSPSKIVWTPPANAGIYDLTVRFFYAEYAQSNNVLLKDTFIDIPYLRSYQYTGNSNSIIIDLSASSVLNFIASKIDPSGNKYVDPTIYRQFKKMRISVSAGGSAFTNYMNSLQAQSGIASNEALPPYTNVVGGVGIFSSRFTAVVDSVLLTNTGLDTLGCSDVSGFLRFKNGTGGICY